MLEYQGEVLFDALDLLRGEGLGDSICFRNLEKALQPVAKIS